MPVPHPLHDGEALPEHPLVEHVARDLVLDPRPDLVGVDEGDGGPPAPGPGAEEEPGLVVDGVDPLGVLVVEEVPPPVVAEDGGERPLHVLLGEGPAEAGHHRHPLAEELVGEAALAVLVLRGLLGVVLLDVVLAVPEELVVLL